MKIAGSSNAAQTPSEIAQRRMTGFITLEEPEKLIVQPCKVGDPVYSISTTAEGPLTKIRILEMEVTNLIVSPENKYRIVAKDAENKNEYFYDASDIDKTLFLTREDAEAELEYYG